MMVSKTNMLNHLIMVLILLPPKQSCWSVNLISVLILYTGYYSLEVQVKGGVWVVQVPPPPDLFLLFVSVIKSDR